ncbi:MAG: transposase [Myxococcota bacterium]
MLESLSTQGGIVIEADRHFPSTRRCSSCGHAGEALALDQRVFRCQACGFEADRDTNAAINLAQFPNLPLPTSEKPSG